MVHLEKEQEDNGLVEKSRRFIRFRTFLLLIIVFASIPFAAMGWNDIFHMYLEKDPPVIQVSEAPRGIGLTPVSINFKLTDYGSGLDEAVIRVRQKTVLKKQLSFELKGNQTGEATIEFKGDKSELDEGSADLEIRVFDRSLWSNVAEQIVPLRVDYRKPKVSALSGQHNARRGGSQLVFYNAFDEELAISGVKVGTRTFLGFPATGIDKEFKDPTTFVAIYAIGLEQDPSSIPIKLFAEDVVGNAVSGSFYNKVASRSSKEFSIKLSDEFLRGKVVSLVDQTRNKLIDVQSADFSQIKGGEDALIRDFKLANQKLRAINNNEVIALLNKSPRQQAEWPGPFRRQNGVTQQNFGDKLVYKIGDQVVGEHQLMGEEILLPHGERNVIAMSQGVVIFAQNIGVYGWTVAIDHGLGLSSLYAHLSNVDVKKGDFVERAQNIGVVGDTGLASNAHLYVEVRVQGVPVDPREWWEGNWFYQHIVGKVYDLKKSLGIPVAVPLR